MAAEILGGVAKGAVHGRAGAAGSLPSTHKKREAGDPTSLG